MQGDTERDDRKEIMRRLRESRLGDKPLVVATEVRAGVPPQPCERASDNKPCVRAGDKDPPSVSAPRDTSLPVLVRASE